MLQSKMRKAGSMQFIETNKNASNNRKDMSTSTEDLGEPPYINEYPLQFAICFYDSN